MTPYRMMTVEAGGPDALTLADEARSFVALPAGQAAKDHMDAISMVMDNPKDRPWPLARDFMKQKRREYSQYAWRPQGGGEGQALMGGGDPAW